MQTLVKSEENSSHSVIEMTPINLYHKFIERVRLHLHIILAFSPIGDNFRNQLRMFPALINCCTIDLFKVNFINLSLLTDT
jgi:dynein heavy chain, axonemal